MDRDERRNITPGEMCWSPEDRDDGPLPRWAVWLWAAGITGSWLLVLALIWLAQLAHEAWKAMP